MKQFLFITVLFAIFFSCSDDENLRIDEPRTEFITWKMEGSDFNNGVIYKYIDASNFEISEDGHNFYLEIEYPEEPYVGKVYTTDNSVLEMGFDNPEPETDIIFDEVTVTITGIDSEYIEANFSGTNSTLSLSEGKFSIKL